MTPLTRLSSEHASEEATKTYLVALDKAVCQNLAFRAQCGIALFGPDQSCMHVVEAMLNVG